MNIKNRKKDAMLPMIIALMLVVGILIGSTFNKPGSNATNTHRGFLLYKTNNKIDQALDLIVSSYVDSISEEHLEEDAIIGMLKTLDPHSLYIPATDLTAINEPIEGNFSGIGVQFNMLDDTIVIVNTIPKGPSEKVGIISGDRIIRVNDIPVAGVKMPSDNIVKMLKGKTGTKVTITVLRKGESEWLNFNVTRDKIPLFSIDAAYMLTQEIGYVKVNKFSKTTLDEFTEALHRLKEEGMQKIIIDLRDNGGGIIDGAIGLSELFLPSGKLIVYTEGNERPRIDYYSKSNRTSYTDMDLVLLINEGSASASEIVAGALQDNDRGTIIGRRSFGKGLVQEQHTLSDGSAIRITVSRYYTPTGRCIQKPYDQDEEKYRNDLYRRYINGEMAQADSIHFNTALKFVTPAGKIVYGGGGIMPDIFVPIDTSAYSAYYDIVLRKGLVYRYAFDYTDRHRKELSSQTDYRTLETYLSKHHILDDFIQYTSKQGVTKNNKDLQISGNAIENMVIAYIARNIFDDKGYYPIINQNDKMIQAGVKQLTMYHP